MNRHFSSQRGFAVVLVLIAIGLAGAMAVLFLSSVASERRGVSLYSRQGQARHLADTAVNLVLAQINHATKEGIGSGQWVSWASQPGMIRTYNASGALSNAYKLYSWDNLVESGGAFNPLSAAEVPSGDWASRPAVYTDLNQPINNVYPIVDPAAMGKVEGFRIDTSNPVATAATTGSAPMPVQWLYILQDGSYVTPSGGSGVQATIPGASSANPIVGRIAFWTDDETAKVNINTASEGTYWDWPKSASADEMQFAANPPVKGEFQRISGHPATTCISPVLPELRKGGASRWNGNNPNDNYLTELQSLYGMSPRIEWGGNGNGSQGGTQPVTSYSQSYTFAASGAYDTPDSITLDADRLYATADDFWFQPGRAANTALSNAGLSASDFSKRLFFLTANSRAPETTLFETPRVSLWPVTWPYPSSFWSKLTYLSTGANAFGGRRGTVPGAVDPASPLTSNKWLTSQESLLAFCSTLNASGAAGTGPRYYFQRQQPDSPTADWTIQRNKQLVAYLRSALNQNVPGFGCSLASKWGTDNADWVALNCFDYARSEVNQTTKEGTPANPFVVGKNELGYSYTGLAARTMWISSFNVATYYEPNAFTVTPLRADFNGKTYVTEGAYPTLDQVSLMFYATGRNEPIPPGDSENKNPIRDTSPGTIADATKWMNLINVTGTGGSPVAPVSVPVRCQTTSMRAVMMFHFSGLSQVPYYAPVFWMKVTGTPFSANGGNINLPDIAGRSRVQCNNMERGVAINRSFMPLYDYTGNVLTLGPKIFANPGEPASSGANVWTLTSSSISVNGNSDAMTFPFVGSKIIVSIYAPDPTNLNKDTTDEPAKLVSLQEVDFSKWNGDLPIPIAPRWNLRDGATKPTITSGSNPWAGSEVVPEINWTPEPPTYSTSAAGGTPITYAYCSGTSTNKVSTDFGQRLRLLLGRNSINYPAGPAQLLAENRTATTGTDRTYDLRFTTNDTANTQGASLITPYDTVISMVASTDDDSGGDPRVVRTGAVPFKRIDQLTAFSGSAPSELFPASLYPRPTAQKQFHALGSPGFAPMTTGYRTAPKFNRTTDLATRGLGVGALGQLGKPPAAIPSSGWVGAESNVTMNLDPGWDWTAMPGSSRDGGYVNRPDQDYQTLYVDYSAGSYVTVPYFQAYGQYGASGASGFMPNRQIPSPVMLGTLPSSLTEGWQTLCFCPNPARGSSHPGLGSANAPSATGAPFSSAPDHLLLDLFWMPVAEPYPISEQFSTAGKVNLNYALAPFSYIQNGGTSYIQRKTALDAVLKPVWINAVRQRTAPDYKSWYNMAGPGAQYSAADQHTRFPINVDETLKAFDSKFMKGDIFRSASQLCEMFLYPNDPSNTTDPVPPLMSANAPLATWDSGNSNINTWWSGYALTSDNGREEPYNAIYSRVTSKSNTYTVHWRVQALRKGTGNQAVWDDSHDAVQAELRGSTLVERYLDPNATNIPDYAATSNYFTAPGDVKPMSAYYKWRVVTENYFQP